jgi:anti-sigma regulatory factor (Ser/Thr protein kinase)
MTQVDLHLPVGPRAASAARSSLAALNGRIPERIFEDLRLLVTELVTNSVRHAGLEGDEPIRLRVDCRPDAIRVEVVDKGPGFEPAVRADPEPEPSGWGLYLVERLADRWGVDSDGNTVVWFEIDTLGR